MQHEVTADQLVDFATKLLKDGQPVFHTLDLGRKFTLTLTATAGIRFITKWGKQSTFPYSPKKLAILGKKFSATHSLKTITYNAKKRGAAYVLAFIVKYLASIVETGER